MITNGSAQVLHRQKFSAFGTSDNPTYQSSNPAVRRVRRGYTGHEHDPETGLVNMKARLYDAVTRKFLTPDPIVQAPGWTQSWNRYSYVFNNPMNWVDPMGLEGREAGDVPSVSTDPNGNPVIEFPVDPLTGYAPDATTPANSETNAGYTIDDFYPATNPADVPPSSPTPLASQGPPSINEGPEGQLISKILEDAQHDPTCELASCPEPTELIDLAQKQQADYDRLMEGRRKIDAATLKPEGLGPGEIVLAAVPGAGVAGLGLRSERVIVGEGASLANITAQEAKRIQNAASRINRPISLVGSRASGKANPADWDYIIEGANSTLRHKIANSLPGAKVAGEGISSTVDFLRGPVDPGRPFITFLP